MNSRQRAIDILRGVAILVVVLYHLISVRVYPEGWWIAYGYAYFLGTWMTNGWLGVSLFFVLSGYVLFLPYAQGKRKFEHPGDVRKFYAHRAHRLLPLYFVSTFVALFILGKFWPQYNMERAFAMATLTFNFFPKYFEPPGNIPLWSLGVVVWYCILFPALSLAMLRGRPWAVFLLISSVSYFTRVIGHNLGSQVIAKSVIANLASFTLGTWIALSWNSSQRHAQWFSLRPDAVRPVPLLERHHHGEDRREAEPMGRARGAPLPRRHGRPGPLGQGR